MWHMFQQIAGHIRGLAAGMIVDAVDDTGGAQTVSGRTHENATRAAVEVAWPFGFSAVSPPDGATTMVIALGGDPANMLALPPSNPAARFGNMAAGEAVIYGGDGSRVHIRAGGVVEIWGGASVTLHTKGCTINAPSGVTINGNLVVNGDVSDAHGTLDRLRGHYNAHVHGSSPGTSQPDPE